MRTLLWPLIALLPLAAPAETVRYALDPGASQVGFAVNFGPDVITGTMPVSGADILLDFDDLTASRISVALGAAGATASFPFATEALTGARVLDTATYPQITFTTDRVIREETTVARVEGQITIRGVTRPITLRAELYRAQGSDPGDLSDMVILMTGAVNRSDFGATGWDDLVADQVRLEITATIRRD
jgi:polyisoprenoid-binding protein YceI